MDQACHDPEDVDKSFLGKRVYFIYPNSVIQNELVAELIRCEFEIYLVKDYQKAITLFRRYPDSVVFVNIDEGQEEAEWEMYIATLQNDPDLAPLQIGVMTYNDDPKLARKYLMDMMIPAGFIKLGLGLKESTATILRVLEVNEARGRRKFLRVKTGGKNATVNLRYAEKNYTGTIDDLSMTGIAVRFDGQVKLPGHVALSGMQLKLKGSLCLVNGIVMGSRCEGEATIWVLLFDPRMNPDVKDKLHKFMQWALQVQVEAELEAIPSPG